MSIDEPAPAGRICFVTDEFTGAGRSGSVGTHHLLLSRVLSARGWNVHVLFCGPVKDEHVSDAVRLAGDGISFTWLDREPAPAWHGIPIYGDGASTTSQRAFEVLERLHAQRRFDVIEFADRGALGFRALQAKRAGSAFSDTRLAVKLHGPSAWQRGANLSNRPSPWELKLEYCERYAFEHADVQLSPSRSMLGDMHDEGWHIREDAVVACPFPGREPGAPPATAAVRELVFFGRLEPRKGLDLFLDALDRLPHALPVLFLGRDGDIDNRSASDVIAERMGERPHRIETDLDRAAALERLLADGRLAVMPSRTESFAFTVAECIVNEIPFLASNVGAIAEAVEHEGARERWLSEPNAGALAEALERRLRSPAAEDRLLRAAAACDPERWNDDVEAAYRALVARVPAPRTPPDARRDATVTVAVAHHNHGDYLPAALASIASQTRRPDEVLVIDDGSTDEDSKRVFAEQQARYPEWTFLRQPNAGPGAARNACLERASGTYFLPFDSDNIAEPTLVQTLLTAVLSDGRDAATCHMLAFVDEQDIAQGRFAFRYAPTGGPRLLTLLENVFGDTCGLFRSEALRAVGGFETQPWSPHEDWETYTKLAFAGWHVDVVPRVLCFYRAEIGGRMDRLGRDGAHTHRLRQRMIRDILADVELNREERILLWECLLGFSEPQGALVALQRTQDELAEWAFRTIDEVHAWREGQLEELRAYLTAQVDAATSRAERAEAELAALRGRKRRGLAPRSRSRPPP